MRRPFAVSTFVLLAGGCSEQPPSCPEGSSRQGDKCSVTDEVLEDGGGDAIVEDDAGAEAPDDAEAEDAGVVADAAPPCYLDRDHDGIGAGEPVPCDLTLEPRSLDGGTDRGAPDGAIVEASANDASPSDGGPAEPVWPRVVPENGDCDDRDPAVAPGQAEVCDGVDNDCDEDEDEEALNACGGPCATTLRAAPGSACTNELRGVCARAGSYVCDGPDRVVCDAPEVAPGTEKCDGLDNDCDGDTDEEDAAGATRWYRDCDGDGFTESDRYFRDTCERPAPAEACAGWTAVVPSTDSRTWDCDDGDARYSPGTDIAAALVPSARNASSDFNCNGQIEKAPPLAQSGPATRSSVSLCPTQTSCDCYAATFNADGSWIHADQTFLTSLPCIDTNQQPAYLALHLVDGPDGCKAEYAGDIPALSLVWQFCY